MFQRKDIDGVLFDLDGTVLDTFELITTSFRLTAERLLPPEADLSLFRNTIGIPLRDQLRLYGNGDEAFVDELWDAYQEINNGIKKQYTRAFPQVNEMLQSLQNAGFPLAVVTAKRHEGAMDGLAHCGLDSYFPVLVGGDEGFAPKPSPETLQEALRQMGLVAGRCIYIGDSPYDIQAGHAAGCVTMGAAWGMYEESLLEQQRPAVMCHEPLDVLRALGLPMPGDAQ